MNGVVVLVRTVLSLSLSMPSPRCARSPQGVLQMQQDVLLLLQLRGGSSCSAALLLLAVRNGARAAFSPALARKRERAVEDLA
ncbi:unnamed protein product [Lampetra planeri]